jgi:hypothetical protein
MQRLRRYWQNCGFSCGLHICYAYYEVAHSGSDIITIMSHWTYVCLLPSLPHTLQSAYLYSVWATQLSIFLFWRCYYQQHIWPLNQEKLWGLSDCSTLSGSRSQAMQNAGFASVVMELSYITATRITDLDAWKITVCIWADAGLLYLRLAKDKLTFVSAAFDTSCSGVLVKLLSRPVPGGSGNKTKPGKKERQKESNPQRVGGKRFRTD